jgi:hypothetical protein
MLEFFMLLSIHFPSYRHLIIYQKVVFFIKKLDQLSCSSFLNPSKNSKKNVRKTESIKLVTKMMRIMP